MLSLLTTLLPLLTIALAAPTPNNGYCHPSRENKVAQYDDLPWIEGQNNPIPTPYLGLDYKIFQVDRNDGFIPPASGDQWTMAFGGSGNITVPDSRPKQSFDLHSFSYACNSGIPQPECAISIWGFKSGGGVSHRVITFPALAPGHVAADFKMNQTSFGGEFQGLNSLGFSIARKDNGGDMFGGLALDDVKYTLRKDC